MAARRSQAALEARTVDDRHEPRSDRGAHRPRIRLAPSYRGDVVGSKLFATRYRIAGSPAYLAREGTPRTPRELSARGCLLFPLPGFRDHWLFRRGTAVVEGPVLGDLVFFTALPLLSAALGGVCPPLFAL